ncbi:hypothetical protein U1Q18_052296 [Sarracenia purpurea var. burkii]
MRGERLIERADHVALLVAVGSACARHARLDDGANEHDNEDGRRGHATLAATGRRGRLGVAIGRPRSRAVPTGGRRVRIAGFSRQGSLVVQHLARLGRFAGKGCRVLRRFQNRKCTTVIVIVVCHACIVRVTYALVFAFDGEAVEVAPAGAAAIDARILLVPRRFSSLLDAIWIANRNQRLTSQIF